MTPTTRAGNNSNAAGRITVLSAFSLPKVSVLFLDAGRAHLAQFVRESGRVRRVGWLSAALPMELPGAVASAELIAALTSLRSASRDSRVVVLLPAHLTLLRHMRIPPVAGRRRAALLEFEARQLLPGAADTLTWDHVPAGDQGAVHTVLLAAAKNRVLEPLCAAISEAGFSVRRVLPMASAIRASQWCRKCEPGGELVLHVGSRAVTLIAVHGRSHGARSWLPAVEVESSDRAAFSAQLVSEVRRSLLHFGGYGFPLKPGCLLLAGDRAASGCDRALLATGLEIRVEELSWSETAAAKEQGDDSALEMTGAATAELVSAELVPNLLPRTMRAQHRRRRRGHLVNALAIVLLCVPLGPLLQAVRLAREADTRGRILASQVEPAERHAAAIRASLDKLSILREQGEAWRRRSNQRGAWLRTLADLQSRVDEIGGVWINRFHLLPTENAAVQIRLCGRLQSESGDEDTAAGEMAQRARDWLALLAASPAVAEIQSAEFGEPVPGRVEFAIVVVAADSAHL